MNIVITGVSSGLGKAVLEHSAAGIEIIGITSSIKKPNLNNVFYYEEINSLPLADVLILNAAIGDRGEDYSSLDLNEFKEIINVNLVKPLAYLAQLKKNNKLINLSQLLIIGSRFSSQSYIDSCNWEELPGYGYCLSKVALSLFCKVIRKENSSFFVNIIHPGILNTQLGNPKGNDCKEAAAELMLQIKNKTFMQNHNGIYDLQHRTLISF